MSATTTTTETLTAKLHLLVTTAHPSFEQHADPETGIAPHPNFGRLLTPRHTSSAHRTAADGHVWACDNDCFQGLHEQRYLAMLDKVRGLPGCRFVTVPDVVADAKATLALFEKWAPIVRERSRQPLALVAQNGIERTPIPWDYIDAIFIGGDDDFKLGLQGAAIAVQARRLGKWVHWGRVNTRTRIEHIAKIGAVDSVDGSSWARFRKARDARGEMLLDKGLRWCREAEDAHLTGYPRQLAFPVD